MRYDEVNVLSDAPDPNARIHAMQHLRKVWRGRIMAPIEPLLNFTSYFLKNLKKSILILCMSDTTTTITGSQNLR